MKANLYVIITNRFVQHANYTLFKMSKYMLMNGFAKL